MPTEHVEKLIRNHKVEFIDLRFADMRGVQHHVTFPKSIIEPGLFEDGKMFDGSSISGWRGIHQSDMVLLPDASTAFLDPFTADPTLVITCDVLDPTTMQAYTRDPRGIAKRAEAYADYTRAREAMLKATHTKHAPWTLVDFNDQKRGRLTLIRDLLDHLPETRVPEKKIEFPPLPGKPLKERYGVLKPIATHED